jgi:hypothetical protein
MSRTKYDVWECSYLFTLILMLGGADRDTINEYSIYSSCTTGITVMWEATVSLNTGGFG